jgi:hypothetical protein
VVILHRLNEHFAILKDIANIYLVPAENLRALVEESSLSKLSPAEVYDFIKLRSDFKANWMGKYVPI